MLPQEAPWTTLQVTDLFVAFAGATVAVNCCVAPVLTVALVGEIDTPVTATFPAWRVIAALEVKLPSAVVTRTEHPVVPAAGAVWSPLVETVPREVPMT